MSWENPSSSPFTPSSVLLIRDSISAASLMLSTLEPPTIDTSERLLAKTATNDARFDARPVSAKVGALSGSSSTNGTYVYACTRPFPFISTSVGPRATSRNTCGKCLRVSTPNCTSPFAPRCIIRAAMFIVSPKRRYRGNFVPMTPATTGPVWMPIRSMTESAGQRSIAPAALKSLSSKKPCPWCSCNSMSFGVTPTHATYSSPTVSILVTWCFSQTRSINVNWSFKNLRSWLGVIELVKVSKSAMTTNNTDTQFT
mmetsp:Transcript_79028/g.228465  ORF Transcript_79028/g.228465 Transcript_79028/m.228465 type:complete len:256 (+) Transcript_79028:1524-2291(+)